MPGGSVNGRPFRENMDSYEKTGIPCGNPKRYRSADVVRMPRSFQDKIETMSGHRPLWGPVEDIETEGQRQLKQMVQKQLDTNVTIQEQLKKSRTFSGGSAFKSLTDDLSGVTSLTTFKRVEQEDTYLYELKQCGLTEDEIEFKIKHDKGISQNKGKYGVDPLVNEEKLKAIERKISARHEKLSLPDKFHAQKEVSRHEMDLEKTLIQDNKQSTTLTTALLKQVDSTEFIHPDHPMNHLPEILKTVTKVTKRRKRKAADDDRNNSVTGECNTENLKFNAYNHEEYSELKSAAVTDTASSDNDVSSKSQNNTQERGQKSSGLQQHCADEESEEDPAKSVQCEYRELRGHVNAIPEEDIKANRLNMQEIKQIPRFQNYDTGIPSKVLYLKNLSNKITEEDLVSLFLRFQNSHEDKIIFRLLTGRMKGQAFVTFHDEDKAKAALELINGFNFKGKPIIIQYGKNKE